MAKYMVSYTTGTRDGDSVCDDLNDAMIRFDDLVSQGRAITVEIFELDENGEAGDEPVKRWNA